MTSITTLLFDIGGVVTFANWKDIYAAFAQRVNIPPSVVTNYHHEHLPKLLTGEISFEQFLHAMRSRGANEENLGALWVEEGVHRTTVNTELLTIIDALRREDYRLAVLTNATESRTKVDEILKIYDHFDDVFISHIEGKRKPDPSFYLSALQKMEMRPEESVFIDDQEKNVTAAEALGMRGIVYTDNASLFSELEKLGVRI